MIKARSFKKALTWKLMSTTLAVAIGYILTGSTTVAFGIALIHIPVSILMYMAHEAAWDKFDHKS